MTDEPPKRRWFQFRLRTLLIAILVLSLPLSWFAWKMERARRQREAVEAIERAKGIVIYDWAWKGSHTYVEGARTDYFPRLRTIVGNDFFDHVECVLAAESEVSDEVLKYVGKLTSLDWLVLAHTEITDTGLTHLKGLNELADLDLTATRITDVGLEHLAGLTSLRELYLCKTRVTPEGVKKLQEALPNCKIEY